jgi:hypothetical protein
MVYSAKSDSTGTINQFTRRKDIKITTGGTSTPTNYQVKVTIAYEPEMQASFQDIRFNTKAGTYIDYWIESFTVSTTATVWLELPNAITDPGSDTIWMYYGNPSASSASNGDNTFLFFDGFEGTSINTSKWTPTGGGITVAASVVTLAASSTNSLNSLLSSPFVTQENTILRAYIKTEYYASSRGEQTFGTMDDITGYNVRCNYNHRYADWVNMYINANQDGTYKNGAIAGWSASVWHIHELFRHGQADWRVDGANLVTVSTYYPTTDIPIYIRSNYYSAPLSIYMDWTLVRKYISSEPTVVVGTAQHQRRTPQFLG